MPAFAPLKFTLYDPETFEARGEYICNFVPLKYLKLAIRLSKSQVNINADTLAGLIVDLFGNRFSADELAKYSDLADRMILLQAVIIRAGNLMRQPSTGKVANKTNKKPDFDLKNEDWIVDLEISLATAFNWSLMDIENTNIETLLPFVTRFAGPSKKAKRKTKVHCDQVSWL